MVKLLLFPLFRQYSFFNIFQYITFRAAYSAVSSFILCIVLSHFLIRLQRKYHLGEIVREDGPPTHKKKKGTPTMGGVAINCAIGMSIVLWMDITLVYTWVTLFVLLCFGILGFVDDYLKLTQVKRRGLRSLTKLVGQIIIGICVGTVLMLLDGDDTTLIYFPFLKDVYIDIEYFYIPFVVLVIISTSNSVNLTDGLDGLASGLVILLAVGISILSYVVGRVDYSEYLQVPFVENAGEFTIVSSGIIGALLGFLWFNSYPASIIMGDTGSLVLGGLISTIVIIIKQELLLILLGGVFVIETLSVIIQVLSFKLRKKRVFKMAPLHHHFELLGWPENKVVMRFWIVGVIFLIIALSTLKIR